ncbi:MAG: molybdate ABC transporter substrate-binding protein [Bacteroidales bacterium]|nr:molybdate ABC transporter substrate-binding protein [Bacteroidales bacterium]
MLVAGSLSEIVDSIAKVIEQETGIQSEINVASSGTLARQIEQGAKASLIFSANTKWIDYLVENQLLCDSCNKKIASNELVLVGSKSDSTLNVNLSTLPKQINKGQKIAIGNPDHVPAGKYAKQTLECLGIFDSVQANILFTKDVRAALILAEMGEAEYAIVYKTDAYASQKVKVLETMADSLHSPIVLSAGLTDVNNKDARLFYEFISTPKAKEIFKHYGFNVK